MNITVDQKNETLAYAAQELSKYLMMMDGNASCDITLEIKNGIVKDSMIDDLIDIDITEGYGYIAGSNARSVLMGVYTYLKSAGCRWVRPGTEGEYIPKKNMSQHSLRYTKKADHSFRGQCHEGATGFEHIRDTILWLPKVNMNMFMIEQIVPYNYMNRWYRHVGNTIWNEQEPPYSQYCDWCLELEQYIKKCGLQFHAMGHGALNEPFGIRHMISGQHYDVPEDVKQAFALVGGKRELYKSSPFFTQLCMSSEWVREKVVNWLADYLEQKPYIDFLHFWLADNINNHCECENCKEKTPSDWYVLMLNRLDEILTERKNNARIVFIMYTDTLWPPVCEKLNNPDRFIVTTACDAGVNYSGVRREGGIPEWKRNDFRIRGGMDMTLTFLDGWKPIFDGPRFVYEYWLYTDHFCDPGYMFLSRRIAKNVKNIDAIGFDGIMSDQTQRAYFPTALPDTVIGEFLFDKSIDTEEFIDDYLAACFGGDYKSAKSYLEKISDIFDYDMLNFKKSVVAEDTGAEDKNAKKAAIHGNTALGDVIATVPDIVDAFAPTVANNLNNDNNCHALSWKMLEYHGEYCKGLSRIFFALSRNDAEVALKELNKLVDYLSGIEQKIHPYFDLCLFEMKLKRIIKG